MSVMRALRLSVAVLLALSASGCSLRSFAVRKTADFLASGGAGWAREDDPELVRDALPFALKTMEGLLDETPHHAGLLLGLCRGFVGYAGGFLEPDAAAIEGRDYGTARTLRDRARRLDWRARGYCLRALDERFAGAGSALASAPDAALARVPQEGVELLYWTGAAWASAIGLGLDRPELVADLPTVRAIFERALALDEEWDRGALHEVMIAFDSFPPAMGGSYERAKVHFARAVELSRGERASPYVAWARLSTVPRQARREFREMLAKARAVDLDASPADRLANRLALRWADILEANVDDLFFAEEEETAPTMEGSPDAH